MRPECSSVPRDLRSGFSILELMIVSALAITCSTIAVVRLGDVIQDFRSDNALRTVAMQMRQARQGAVDRRRLHRVRFEAPGTITVERQGEPPDQGWNVVRRAEIDPTVEFRAEPGIPTNQEQTPDRASGDESIDFNGSAVIIFRPDGTAVDENGGIASGVAYLARPGKLRTARAVTLFGSTGRIRQWRILESEGAWKWH